MRLICAEVVASRQQRKMRLLENELRVRRENQDGSERVQVQSDVERWREMDRERRRERWREMERGMERNRERLRGLFGFA